MMTGSIFQDESEFVNGETLVVDNTLSTGVQFDKILQAL